jgi:hypothetical protein
MTKDYLKKNGKSLLISVGGFLFMSIGLGLADIKVTDPNVAVLLGALSSFLVNFGRLTLGK